MEKLPTIITHQQINHAEFREAREFRLSESRKTLLDTHKMNTDTAICVWSHLHIGKERCVLTEERRHST
ncbi:hypothetical protein E2C01_059406 [Portunus trituberculatus]|uniref:Uncharacterized protein n=1 Tax=Portunus trituberculatus TaxID=210409 RepID=A0A5B7H598_PORTR|nr:hypothetical protein [Portunus trituberculatus]